MERHSIHIDFRQIK